MKKKGFTLVELLAVIVIISVIALIATPIIYNLISNSKEQAFRNKIYAIEEAANTYYEDLILEGNEEEFSKGLDGIYSLTLDLSKKEDIEKLDIKGKTIKKGIVTITEEGKVSITAVEEKLCGQKISTSEVINMLNIKEDFTCYLLDSSSGDIGTQDILTAIQNLSNEVKELKKSNEDLTVSNQELKDTIEDMNNNGVGTENALNKIYPVGSIYISTTLNTKEKVKEAIGGEWENYGDGKVLRGTTGTSDETGGASNVSLTTANLPTHSHSISHTHTTPRITIASSGAHTHSTTAANVAITRGLTAQSAGAHSHSLEIFPSWPDSVNSHRPEWQVKYESGGASSPFTRWFSSTASAGAHTHNVTGTITIPALSVASSGAHTHNVQAMTTNSQSTTTSGDVGTNTSFSVLDPYITVYMYKRVK